MTVLWMSTNSDGLPVGAACKTKKETEDAQVNAYWRAVNPDISYEEALKAVRRRGYTVQQFKCVPV